MAATMLLHNMLSPRTPRHDAFETRCRLCSKWRQPSKSRAQPLDVGGQPRRNASSQPEMRGRHRSIKDHPHEVKTTPVQEHLVDTQWWHDARHDINEYRRRRHGDAEECGYSAHRGGRYDSDED